jgi:hypothetical protein
MGDDTAFFRASPDTGHGVRGEDGDGNGGDDGTVTPGAAFEAALVEVGRAFSKTPREIYETMGLNEFQEAHRCIMQAQGLEFRASILASFYGSRSDVDKLQGLLDRLSAGSETRELTSLANVPLQNVTTETLIDQGFEKVELVDGNG